MVLPDGPPALSHPTNEDLFAGTPVQRPLGGVCTLFLVNEAAVVLTTGSPL
jgi:hypothetical protein